MECKACGTVNPESHRFCDNCGEGLAQRCKACDHPNKPGAHFCGGCGAVLGAVTAPARVELKYATVLFADIVSSTEQIALLDPEEAMARLQPAIMTMCEAVERFGGTILRTLGDGVMAIFGVPKALEGDAVLACEAALEMQRAFAGETGKLSIRVGLHSGLVASDPYAPDGGKGGGAHGMTIHLASRVVGMAPPGKVALTRDCLELVRAAVETTSLGFKALKGVPQPVEVFTLDKLKPAFASHRFQQGALTALRGRDHELQLLQQMQRNAEAGLPGVVGIGGAPGTGKSRLCFEFAQWCRSRQVSIYEVRAQLYGHSTPFQAALELIRSFVFGMAAGGTPDQAEQQVREVMASAGLLALADVGLMLDFLGIRSTDQSAVALSPRVRRARLQQVVSALFCHAGSRHAIIILEDLHWLDDASREIFSTLMDALNQTRVGVVLNYRSPYEPVWADGTAIQRIELSELGDADANAMVRELIGRQREQTSIHQLIVKRSGGNPFFAEELVRSLEESGALSGDSEDDLESVERSLPLTVQAVIGARIDRVAEADKGVLQICAIVGKDVPVAVLAQVAAVEANALRQSLLRLCASGLLCSTGTTPERGYAFRHPLIQEVAYSSQLKARRGSLHARVADAMLTFYGARVGEFAALIAFHYEAAGHVLQAAVHEGLAAQWIGATGSARAIQHWHKVRSLLDGRPPEAESDRLRAMACSKIVFLGWREGTPLREAQPYIDEAMAIAKDVDRRMVELLLFVEGRMLQAGGGPADRYVQKMKQAIALQTRPKESGRTATLHAALCQALGWAGLLREALQANDVALCGLPNIDAYDREFIGFSVEHWIIALRGRLLARMGRFAEAAQWLDRMLLSSQPDHDPLLRQIAHYGYVELAWYSGNAELARRHASVVAEIAEKVPSPYLKVFGDSSLGMALGVAGDHEGALRAFNEALHLVRSGNVAPEFETELLAHVAESHRQLRHYDQAAEMAQEAIALSRMRNTRLPECRALITLGACWIAHPQREGEGRRSFERARELIAICGVESYGALLSREISAVPETGGPRVEPDTESAT